MTKEEAIKILKAIRVYDCYPKSAGEETKEAIDMAIEALSAESIQTDKISRADAIDFVTKLIWNDGEIWNDVQDRIVDGINALPSAEAVQGWIPCSERLPNNDGCVLVTIDDNIEFGKYEDGSWSIWVCEHWDKWDAKGTIAWMPLPEPYKAESEDKE